MIWRGFRRDLRYRPILRYRFFKPWKGLPLPFRDRKTWRQQQKNEFEYCIKAIFFSFFVKFEQFLLLFLIYKNFQLAFEIKTFPLSNVKTAVRPVGVSCMLITPSYRLQIWFKVRKSPNLGLAGTQHIATSGNARVKWFSCDFLSILYLTIPQIHDLQPNRGHHENR